MSQLVIRCREMTETEWNQPSPYAKRRQLANMRSLAPKSVSLWARIVQWLSEDI